MTDHFSRDEIVRSNEDLANTSQEELTAMRTEALRRLHEAEKKGDEALHLAQIYEQAREQLAGQAEQLLAEAKECDSKGEGETAQDRRAKAEVAAKMAEKNSRLALEKQRIASEKAQQAQEDQSLAAKLTAQIKKKASPWADWEL